MRYVTHDEFQAAMSGVLESLGDIKQDIHSLRKQQRDDARPQYAVIIGVMTLVFMVLLPVVGFGGSLVGQGIGRNREDIRHNEVRGQSVNDSIMQELIREAEFRGEMRARVNRVEKRQDENHS